MCGCVEQETTCFITHLAKILKSVSNCESAKWVLKKRDGTTLVGSFSEYCVFMAVSMWIPIKLSCYNPAPAFKKWNQISWRTKSFEDVGFEETENTFCIYKISYTHIVIIILKLDKHLIEKTDPILRRHPLINLISSNFRRLLLLKMQRRQKVLQGWSPPILSTLVTGARPNHSEPW